MMANIHKNIAIGCACIAAVLVVLVLDDPIREQQDKYEHCLDSGKASVFTDSDIVDLEAACERRTGYQPEVTQ